MKEVIKEVMLLPSFKKKKKVQLERKYSGRQAGVEKMRQTLPF